MNKSIKKSIPSISYQPGKKKQVVFLLELRWVQRRKKLT